MKNNNVIGFIIAYIIAFIPLESFIFYTICVAFTGKLDENLSSVLTIILVIQVIWLLTCKVIGYVSLTPKVNRSFKGFYHNCWNK